MATVRSKNKLLIMISGDVIMTFKGGEVWGYSSGVADTGLGGVECAVVPSSLSWCHSTHVPYLIGCYVEGHGTHSCFRLRKIQRLLTSWFGPRHGWRLKYNPSGPRCSPFHITRSRVEQKPSSVTIWVERGSTSRLLFRISKTDQVYKILLSLLNSHKFYIDIEDVRGYKLGKT